MTDKTPERIWLTWEGPHEADHWFSLEAYSFDCPEQHEFIRLDLHAAVVAERDQLEEAVNELLIVWQNDGSVNDLDLVKLHAAIKAIETSRTELEKNDG